MSDRMTPIPFAELMNWILTEYSKGSVFAINRRYTPQQGKQLDLFGEHLETPFGPAAGPHTQLTQNIIAAYYAGCRFFELKTVQTLDGEDLPVSKPCILAEDECYNVEWSTELTVNQAFGEYIKAWYALKLLTKEFDWGCPNGFMFNMSVGYDYKGIISPKIDNFIEGLKNAAHTEIWQECRKWAENNLGLFHKVDAAYLDSISPKVCTSITLSTLHGCPPQEIERIASYLIDTKKLNTFVKCNPTLLGYEFARRTVDEMGYDYLVFDEHHFQADLQWTDAVPMFRRMLRLAKDNSVSFGLKLTNTFPVGIARQELPGEEMYMSGRSLYPLTMELARRISQEFDGQMRISYSGGADYFNIEPLFKAGIWPITMATTLLKPGGYQRCTQLAELLGKLPYTAFNGVSVEEVAYLANMAKHDLHHLKALKPNAKRKIAGKSPRFDCFIAPCNQGCPIKQDIPEYIKLVGQGQYVEALQLIVEKNPLPFITGTICSHRCMDKCTRNFYESSVHIRDMKLRAAYEGFAGLMEQLPAPGAFTDHKVAIIGGGPAGLAAAFFLGRAGIKTTIFEKAPELGGIVRHVIPEFRINRCAIERDIALVQKMGCQVRTNTVAPSAQELLAGGYSQVIYAIGAWKAGKLRLEAGEALNVIDFLAKYKAGQLGELGENVIVIGGGNTAMDAARAARRCPGVKRVQLVYRRTRRYMPADEEELHLALNDGVEFAELLAPVAFENGKLRCRKMVLGAPDASGRRSPVETDEFVCLDCSTLIAAVGEKVDSQLFADNGIKLNEKGSAVLNPETLETSLKGVYVIGDAHRGPATVVEAIADASLVAETIAGPYTYSIPAEAKSCSLCASEKVGLLRLFHSTSQESSRCLSCSTLCESCVQVCPNRAYVPIIVPGMEKPQILHIDRMCNYCGNCTAFCPYDSSPYQEKISLFSTVKEFDESDLPGFVALGNNQYKVRLNETKTITLGQHETCPDLENLIEAVASNYSYLL